MPKPPKISDAEWQVMDVLWAASGPLTANEIVDSLADHADWSPPTIKTMLNRLVRKRALKFKAEGKRYLYSPAVSRELCVRSETRSFVDRLFGGSIAPLLAHFVEDEKLSKEEIEQLRKLLERKGSR